MDSEFQAGQRFFFEFEGDEGYLSPTESHHAVKVLRKKVGDELKLINGRGKEYRGRVLEIRWKKRSPLVRVRLEDLLREEVRASCEIVALIPILKGDMTEFLIEKGTELGVNRFLIYYSDHTVVRSQEFKRDRYLEKAISSLKQSGRLYLPEITIVGKLKHFLIEMNESTSEIRIVAHQRGSASLRALLQRLSEEPFERVLAIIGPEGDFSEEELSLLQKGDFHFLSLSPYILRAETAFCVLCGLISSTLWHSPQSKGVI